MPDPRLIECSNLTAFMRHAGETAFEAMAAHANADPAWLMRQVFGFCDCGHFQDDKEASCRD